MTEEIKLAEEIDAAPTDTEQFEQPKKKGRSAKQTVPTADDAQETLDEDVQSVLGDTSQSLGIFALTDDAVIPEFKTEESACFDLSAKFNVDDKVKCISQSQTVAQRRVTDKGVAIHQGERLLIPTGLAFDIPQGYCLEIYPRSGISFSRGISLNNCTAIIDSDYVEEVFISVNNVSGGSQYIENGERIAQAKLVKLVETKIEVLTKKPGQKTSRSGGFGSTGNK